MNTQGVSYKLADLRAQAKSLGLKGWSVANKERLIDMLENAEPVKTTEPVFEAKPKATKAKAAKAAKAEAHPVVVAETEALAAVAAAPKPKKDISNSPWHQFLDQFTKEHGVSRKQAMSAKDEYAAFKANLVKA